MTHLSTERSLLTALHKPTSRAHRVERCLGYRRAGGLRAGWCIEQSENVADRLLNWPVVSYVRLIRLQIDWAAKTTNQLRGFKSIRGLSLRLSALIQNNPSDLASCMQTHRHTNLTSTYHENSG